MKKRIIRTISMLLVMAIIFATVGCGKGGDKTDSQSGDLSWLNTGGTLPIVKEGTEKTLKVAIQMYSDAGDPDTQWFYKFIEKEMNIKLEVTKIKGTEQLKLMLADGELPDIIIGAISDTSSLMRYGADEGMFADLAPYINETLTPNLHKLYSEHPEYKVAVEDRDGHIWSLGFVNDPASRGNISRAFYNYDWLEEVGCQTPTNIDEFLNVMREFKKLGNDVTPMAGSWTDFNPCLILLNSFGYLTENARGLDIALRNGEVVLPVADREVYGEYLKLLKQVYDERLIDENFFTMTNSATTAKISSGKCGYLAEAPFVFVKDFGSWWGAQPLTSAYNSTPQWPQGAAALTCGGFVVSAQSENKELAMAFADWFYEESGKNYYISVNGPAATQEEYIYDDVVTGFTIDEENFSAKWPYYEENQASYSSKNDYIGKEIYLWGFRMLGNGLAYSTQNVDALVYGYSPEEISNFYTDVTADGIQADVRKEAENDGEMCFRLGVEDTLLPYVSEDGLSKAYLEASVGIATENMMMLVKEYAIQETAAFVTGRRPLTDDELNKYFDEIEALGAKEVVDTYKEYYGR